MPNQVNFLQAPFGVYECIEKNRKGIRVQFVSAKNNCGIILFSRKDRSELARISFDEKNKKGNLYSLFLEGYSLKKISYLFFEENKPVIDKKALLFEGKDSFGFIKTYDNYRSIAVNHSYDWEEDKLPALKYEDSIGYCMHVRGFTMHKSSKVKAKGTFKGIIEKTPYLKELGITTLELQPAYEFAECPIVLHVGEKTASAKVNYWGYEEGFYYMPKRSYAYSQNVVKEFKDMVKELHKNHMELIMQFYFPKEFPCTEMLPILRYWHTEYHVDGFHVKGANIPIYDILSDPYLTTAKIWHEGICKDLVDDSKSDTTYKRAALYNDVYLCNVRGLLKADDGMLEAASKCILDNPKEYGKINYLSNYFGFTFVDMVAYQMKHNEANGEQNRDGTDYNCTWNCGVEGNTRKKDVLDLRLRQVKNAFALLFLSQGLPLIYMGDEFGRTQKGNNNPYCQDNEITWVNWKLMEKNKELFDYVQYCIEVRRKHKVFAAPKAYAMTDYKETGCPDLSLHDKEAWKYSWEKNESNIGFMINGDYVEGCEGMLYYMAVNTHWESGAFALPRISGYSEWTVLFKTIEEEIILEEGCVTLPQRSIFIFSCKKDAQ